MRLSMLIGMMIMAMCVGLNLVAAEGKGPWQKVWEDDLSHACTLAGFETESYGITVGYAGEVHYTKDGGKTWPRASSFSACRFGLEIVNDKVAWHSGNQGNVRLSVDGGEVWDSVSNFGPSEPDHCRFLSFINETTGWIASPYDLASTSDGGKTWELLALPKNSMDISAIDIRSKNEGYLLDCKGRLFVTADGGKKWEERSLGLAKDVTLMLLYTPTAAMRFTDKNHGIVVYCQKGLGTIAMITADGGKTWKTENIAKSIGGLYLSKNGKLLTVTSRSASSGRSAKVTIFKRNLK